MEEKSLTAKPTEKTNEPTPQNQHFIYKSNHIFEVLPPCSVDFSYFKQLYAILKTATEEGADIEISKVKRSPGQSEEELDKFKKDAKELFKVSIQIYGAKGGYVFTENPSIFDDPSLPSSITKVILENSSKYKFITQREPINRLRITFDFTKPRIFDFNTAPSYATPINSTLEIFGENETWVSGVYKKAIESLEEKGNVHGWLHVNNIYDLFLWFFIIPLDFRLLYIINHSLPEYFSKMSVFLKSAIYLYFFILTLNVFRMIFNYARWVFPYVELISPVRRVAIKHRYVLGAIVLPIIIAVIYDLIIKRIFF